LILGYILTNMFQTSVKKASRQLNVLKRIGKYLCKLRKLNIYYSFILSNINTCPLTWHFCSETNTKKVENIQKRALLRWHRGDIRNTLFILWPQLSKLWPQLTNLRQQLSKLRLQLTNLRPQLSKLRPQLTKL